MNYKELLDAIVSDDIQTADDMLSSLISDKAIEALDTVYTNTKYSFGINESIYVTGADGVRRKEITITGPKMSRQVVYRDRPAPLKTELKPGTKARTFLDSLTKKTKTEEAETGGDE